MVDCIHSLQVKHLNFQVCHLPIKKINTFKSGYIYMKDTQYVDTNEKSIFRILIFGIWSILQ